MISPTFQTRLGATPGKLALTAILALSLVYVLYGNFSSTESPTHAPKRPVSSAIAHSLAAAAAASTTAAKFVEQTPWSKIPLEEISRYDPFEAKLPGDQQRRIRSATTLKKHNEDFTLDDIQNAKTAIVLVSGGSKIARYGATELRVGDRVEDYRVRDITIQGVTLEE